MSHLNPSGHDIRPRNQQLGQSIYQESQGGQDDTNHLSSTETAECHSPTSLPYDQPALSVAAIDPPQSSYDPNTLPNAFSSMHIGDGHTPKRNGTLPPSQQLLPDPVPRAPSAMSMNNSVAARAGYPLVHPPRHAATLPSSIRSHTPFAPGDPSQQPLPPGYQQNTFGQDYPSYNELGQLQQGGVGGGYAPPESFHSQSHHQPPYAMQWQQQQQPHYAPSPPPGGGGYNTFHMAASDVLGMGLPPGSVQGLPMSRSLGPGASPVPSNSSMYAPSVSSGHSGSSGPSYQQQQPTSEPYASHSPFDPRPSYRRAETSASLAPSSAKSKAVDLNSPPYTKEYIDQYRQRIKADKDPEAHFLYAKYLIDAARHIRTSLPDQKAARKYCEFLIIESLKVMRRLATQGDAYDEAQFFLANCYGTGALGLQVDHERAYHLYLQATKQNHAAASYRVAVSNEIGAGTKRDPSRAATFYRKAASLGDTPGMYKLGMILLNGYLGEQRNPREAIGWLKRAAEQADEDNPHAVHELALVYESPSGTLVPHDPVYAKNLLTHAAQLGYTPSQFKLGQCFEYGTLTCPVDPKRSIAWYTKAAEKGFPEAELALSGWYLTGSEGILKQSDSEAYLWARRAANKGLNKAEYAVGYYAEVGIGIKQDIEFAKKYYMRAAAQGNSRAMNRLKEMKRSGAAKRGNISRPTRQQDGDDCIIS